MKEDGDAFTFVRRFTRACRVGRNPDFLSDLAVAVAPLAECADVFQQIYRSMLAPGTILDQAHDKTFAFFGLHDQRRDRVLSELHKRLYAPSSAS